MHNIIRLELTNGQWIAHHMGPHSDDIVQLFGTDKIPTPYTGATSLGTVVAALSKLNPTVEVL